MSDWQVLHLIICRIDFVLSYFALKCASFYIIHMLIAQGWVFIVLMCLWFVDPSVLQDTLVAHTDAVWGLSIHSSKMQLLSCSADATVRLWSPGQKSPLLNTYRVDDGKSQQNTQVLKSSRAIFILSR